jgi:HD-GYP domain-containing protein (c-di-GMP phosphodiesterase class II)
MVEPMRSPRRRRLIAAAAATQAVMLVAAGIVAFHLLRHRFALSIQDAVYARNDRAIDHVADALRELKAPVLSYGTWEWERAQTIIEQAPVPTNAYACLIDAHGNILCHPGLRRDPALRGKNLGGIPMDPPNHAPRLVIADADADHPAHGRARFIGQGTQFISAMAVPEVGARVAIVQPESGLLSLGQAGTREAGWILGASAATAAFLTLALGITLSARYERVLRGHNREIDREVHERTDRTLATRNALILGLAKLADYRDSDRGAHLDRICAYSAILAEQLRGRFEEIDATWVQRLKLAASLHDIGKAGVADSVLLKPGELSDSERTAMRRHPVIGADNLLALRRQIGDDPLLNMAIQVALEHHERWDGKGYPLGLRGDQIAIAARIVAVADVYDALTSARVYKEAFSHEKACAVIREGRGAQFDPRIVEAFEHVSDRIDQIRLARPLPAPPSSDADPSERRAA